MGAAVSCCQAPSAQAGQDEAVRRDPAPRSRTAAGQRGPAASAATAAASPQHSPGYYSTADGYYSDAEDEWHDALSQVDLAEALEEWETEQLYGGHDAGVDQAIQVLRAHGHLLPPGLEAAALEQRTADREQSAGLEGGARVHVAAVPPAVRRLALDRATSQELRLALDQPAVRTVLAAAATLAGKGRVLAAHGLALHAAKLAGFSLAELAALPAGMLAAVLPAGASLDVASLAGHARFAEEALQALDDHTGWMVSRNDELKVYYRHHKGTTVHSLKFSAVFDHSMEHLLAIAHEFDLVVTWNKFTLASMMLAETDMFGSYLYGAQWMMRPFKDMQGLLHARGFDLADEHRCLLVSLSDAAPEALPEGHTPLPPEFYKRKTVNFLPGSCLKIKPLPDAPDGTPRTEGALLLHIDPHIPFIPAFLLNFVLGVLSPYVFGQMRKVLDSNFADESSIYCQRIREQPKLYGLLRSRLAEFEAELTPGQSAADEATPAGAGLSAAGKGTRKQPARRKAAERR